LSWLSLLFWGALGLQLAGMAILATERLPPAAVTQGAGVDASAADDWTFPPGCFSW
jgi:hypothetical protein